jgi:NADH:ubiquinone oxidoreductase subunit 5 (subunit L)/multisubunit Na+/H+ antiporter MnhA subunit
MNPTLHPAAPHHLPAFIAAPGETDVFMVVMAVLLVIAVMAIGLLFLRLHTLPERIAHKGHKLQFEIVAVLGLLALLTHIHAFWVAGLLLALIDIPDFGWPLRRIAGSLEKIPDGTVVDHAPGENTADVPKVITLPRMPKDRTDA